MSDLHTHPADESHPALRRAVHQLRTSQRRRIFPAELRVGDLDGDWRSHLISTSVDLDLGSRTDVATELLGGVDSPQPAAWLVRVGMPLPHDLDMTWLAPMARVFAEAGIVPRCLAVVTKNGWYAPYTDTSVTWKRLRIRPRVAVQ